MSWDPQTLVIPDTPAGSTNAVSISSDRKYIAIGSNKATNGSGKATGRVVVYGWDDVEGEWVQSGQAIFGAKDGDEVGISVSLSADGARLAVGARGADLPGKTDAGTVTVYRRTANGNFVAMGASINGVAARDFTGISVSLSGNGNRVAVGSSGADSGTGANKKTDAGSVRIYELLTMPGLPGGAPSYSWVQMNTQTIFGDAALDYAGYSVSLSADGQIVAIGAYGAGEATATDNRGSVRVVYWENTAWVSRGQTIYGEADGDEAGYSVSLSADGTVLAVGSKRADKTNPDAEDVGCTRLFLWNLSDIHWDQLGETIYGEATGDFSGISVSLSADGARLAVGASYADATNPDKVDAGSVRTYRLKNGSYVPETLAIFGAEDGDLNGSSVSLSVTAEGALLASGGEKFNLYSYTKSSNTDLSVFTVDDSAVSDNDTVALSNGTASVVVVATPTDSNATAVITGDSSLSTGDNTLTVEVTAEDGTKRTYSVTLHVKNNNTDLSVFTVDDSAVSDNDTVALPYGTASVVVVATPADSNATAVITGDSSLSTGDNTLTVEVTAEDGTKRTYSVTLQVADEPPVCFLASTPILTPSGYKAIETIARGDLVVTSDGRSVPVRNTKIQKVVRATKASAPYFIPAGCLGPSLPRSDIVLSPGHCLQVSVEDDLWISAWKCTKYSADVKQVHLGESFTYYNLTLPKYSDNLVIFNGVVVESMGPRTLELQKSKMGYRRVPKA